VRWRRRAIIILFALLLAEILIASASLSVASSIRAPRKEVQVVNYYASIGTVVKSSLRQNLLYNSSNVSDQQILFHNITNNISVYAVYVFDSNVREQASVIISMQTTLVSGTTPGWTKNLTPGQIMLKFNSTNYTNAVSLPIYLNSTLAEFNSIDNQLNLQPGDPTIRINVSETTSWDNFLFQNYTVAALTFYYPTYFHGPFDPLNWSYASVTSNQDSNTTGSDVYTLTIGTNNARSGYSIIGWLSIIISISIASVIVAGLMPAGAKGIEGIIKGNRDNIIFISDDPRQRSDAIRLKDPEELLKLSDITGNPMFLFEDDKARVLSLTVENQSFYFEMIKESNPKPQKMIYRNTR